MAIKHLTDEQVREWSLEQKDRWWLENVFRGNMPQLTLRSALTGFFLGGILSATNLYVGAKTGWSLGVGITSVILAFALFKALQRVGLAKEYTILENNAMQSIATAAGYMTSPLISSLTAYMIIKGELLPWWQMVIWMVLIAILGVLFAFPMKRKFINDEQHPFPEGRAAGVVMDTLHSDDAKVGMIKARFLLVAAGVAGFLKFIQSESIMEWIQVRLLGRQAELAGQIEAIKRQMLADDPRPAKEVLKKLKEHAADLHDELLQKLWYIPEQLDTLMVKLGLKIPKLANIDVRELTLTPALDISLIGAGGLMGIRGGVSLLIGAVLNYCILAPWMAHMGEIVPTGGSLAEGTATFGLRRITLWSLWPGVACMVIASFVAFFAKPEVFVSAFRTVFGKKKDGSDVLKHIELPLWISVVGVPIFSVLIAVVGHEFFGVKIWVSLVGLPLTFVLALIAANSTALTSTTPVGATAKVTQLFYGVVKKGDITANVATASITAEVVSNASNLLMDIKPGYMLGAKPRQQAIGHVIGIIAGSLAAVPLFFVLFTKDVIAGDPASLQSIQGPKFPMPAVTVWKAVAEVLTKGLGSLESPHNSIIYAVVVACLVGLSMEIARLVTKGKFPLSPIGLGLAFVMNFQSAFAMFLGAFAMWCLGAGRIKDPAKAAGNPWIENHEPICAGVIAGAALVGIADALIAAFVL
jgi:OPT family oligopeptide transporter